MDTGPLGNYDCKTIGLFVIILLQLKTKTIFVVRVEQSEKLIEKIEVKKNSITILLLPSGSLPHYFFKQSQNRLHPILFNLSVKSGAVQL